MNPFFKLIEEKSCPPALLCTAFIMRWSLSQVRMSPSLAEAGERVGITASATSFISSWWPQFWVSILGRQHLKAPPPEGFITGRYFERVPKYLHQINDLQHSPTRWILTGKQWQTFPSFRQVLASPRYSSSPTRATAGPVSDGNSCRSRIPSACSTFMSNQLRVMNAIGSAAKTKRKKKNCSSFFFFPLHVCLSS